MYVYERYTYIQVSHTAQAENMKYLYWWESKFICYEYMRPESVESRS